MTDLFDQAGAPKSGSVCKLNHRKLCQSPAHHSEHREREEGERERGRERAFSGTGTRGHVEVFIWGSS